MDLDSLYGITLATVDAGRDARHLYEDAQVIGHIYVGPYAHIEPRFCIVAEDDVGVAGYAVGIADTQAWFDRLERDWWPRLRKRYDDPGPDLLPHWSHDQRRAFLIHHPVRTPYRVSDRFPAHMHLNLLPRLQGRGVGSRLLAEWLAQAAHEGIGPIHIGANRQNGRGIAFWARNGFQPLQDAEGVSTGSMWMGRD